MNKAMPFDKNLDLQFPSGKIYLGMPIALVKANWLTKKIPVGCLARSGGDEPWELLERLIELPQIHKGEESVREVENTNELEHLASLNQPGMPFPIVVDPGPPRPFPPKQSKVQVPPLRNNKNGKNKNQKGCGCLTFVGACIFFIVCWIVIAVFRGAPPAQMEKNPVPIIKAKPIKPELPAIPRVMDQMEPRIENKMEKNESEKEKKDLEIIKLELDKKEKNLQMKKEKLKELDKSYRDAGNKSRDADKADKFEEAKKWKDKSLKEYSEWKKLKAELDGKN